MTQIYDVLIVGGGVVGLTAALAMQQKGYQVALLDGGNLQVDPALSHPRVYAINAASIALLYRIGVWQEMDITLCSPYKYMHVWDAKSGASISFEAKLMAASELGFIIEETQLRQALLKKISTLSTIHLYPESSVHQVTEMEDKITIEANANSWTGKLLLVTDGANSKTRELLKVPLTVWPYHQEALVATVKTDLPHQKTAWQVFHPQGPLAFLPMVDANTCSIVWTTTPEIAQELLSLPEKEFNHRLTKAFVNKLGNVTLHSIRNRFPLTMRHVKQYVGKNWLLAGDAAHTIHPLAGLGLNLGLADITTWLNVLPPDSQFPVSFSVLQAYQRTRKNDTWQVIALMEGLKRLFGTEWSPLVMLRSLGLNAFDGFTPIKRLLVSQAMGMGRMSHLNS